MKPSGIVIALVLGGCGSPRETPSRVVQTTAREDTKIAATDARMAAADARMAATDVKRVEMHLARSRIALAAEGACVVDDQGLVSCAGTDYRGLLGRETPKTSRTLLVVPGIDDAVEVATSGGHTCVVRATGIVMCWGSRHSGELGDGFHCAMGGTPPCKGAVRKKPAPVAGLDRVTGIALGGGFTCALRTDRTVSCVGEGLQVAGSDEERRALRTIDGIERSMKLVAGASHACTIRDDATVWCFGYRSSIGLPHDPTIPSEHGARQVQGLANIVAIAAGFFQTCAVRDDGAVLCWGSNRDGECGDLDGPDYYADPVVVRGIDDAIDVAAGYSHTCALRRTGEVWCWGSTSHVVPKHPSYRWSSPPAKIALSEKAVALVSGPYTACATLASGKRTCWGTAIGDL
jgi:alpha-tubulin suppressor-like RCC1 family protein